MMKKRLKACNGILWSGVALNTEAVSRVRIMIKCSRSIYGGTTIEFHIFVRSEPLQELQKSLLHKVGKMDIT